MNHTDEYKEYLNSFAWKIQRVKALERANWRCEKCGKSRYQITLQVHHLTYDNLGHEKAEDLQVLCKSCHEAADGQRHAANDAKLRGARLDGWATKRYGEEWWDRFDPETVREEFDEWLERQQY